MLDYRIGQEVVCINVDEIDGQPVHHEIRKFLKVGEVYIIRDMVIFPYLHSGEVRSEIGFKLKGIRCEAGLDHNGKFWEYAFFHGRFKPVEKKEDKAAKETGVPLEDILKIDGSLSFDDEFEDFRKEVEKVKETTDADRNLYTT
jgi:hypothetical protein